MAPDHERHPQYAMTAQSHRAIKRYMTDNESARTTLPEVDEQDDHSWEDAGWSRDARVTVGALAALCLIMALVILFIPV